MIMMNPKVIDTFVGVGAPALGLITSMQAQLEYWLRIGSLVLGIAVALVSLVRLFSKKR
tara:strand:+ start:565 stop:741 length:177 start_codon:yes stop_codon:yes gene_type:complete